jgi:hypothetical protein
MLGTDGLGRDTLNDSDARRLGVQPAAPTWRNKVPPARGVPAAHCVAHACRQRLVCGLWLPRGPGLALDGAELLHQPPRVPLPHRSTILALARRTKMIPEKVTSLPVGGDAH